MKSILASLLAKPRAGQPPVRVWRDWLILAAVIAAAALEGILRKDTPLLSASTAVTAGLAFTVLWRRVEPLRMLVVALSGFSLLSLIVWVSEGEVIDIYSSVFVLLLVYSAFRWGSGREIGIALRVMAVVFMIGLITDYTGIGEAIGGLVVFLLPAEIGVWARSSKSNQIQKIEQIKAEERSQLARELHDTVAHHLSAIAIQAQAGRVLVESSSVKGAIEALNTIEEEASRSLAEMRSMIGILRNESTPMIEAQFGVADLDQLAQSKLPGAPAIEICRSGYLDHLRPTVQAALFRLAQESVANAVRHSQNATKVKVLLHGDVEVVRLAVVDNGEVAQNSKSRSGYGIIGMNERATLLGGTLCAGPRSGQGWMVEAVIPRQRLKL